MKFNIGGKEREFSLNWLTLARAEEIRGKPLINGNWSAMDTLQIITEGFRFHDPSVTLEEVGAWLDFSDEKTFQIVEEVGKAFGVKKMK